MKNRKLKGTDPVFINRITTSIIGRDVIHLMHDYPRETESLCGKLIVNGHNRYPEASPDMTFTVCGECLKHVGF